MTTNSKDLPLLGYVDRLSARPGDILSFKVSSLSDKPFTARLTRSISADPNPEGMGIVEENASEFFPSQSFASRHQSFFPGSYGLGATAVSATPASRIEFEVIVFPTLQTGKPQTLISIGAYDLQIDANGAACLKIGDHSVTTDFPLSLRDWYKIRARIEYGEVRITHTGLGRYGPAEQSAQATVAMVPISGTPSIAAIWSGETFDQFFNGKVEAPSIAVDGKQLCAWNFSKSISSTKVPALTGPDLALFNYPSRAMTGSAWDGTEMNWTHRPDHYGAIHFHEDDIYDFGWDTDFTFSVPEAMPSGIYVMRLECEGQADAIPFFVCAHLGKPQADLCVLVSTFTYSIYGNHARPDYDPSWQTRISGWDAYPHNPAEHREYGLSTYNFHSDGSGIGHASHLRPLFNLRPGFLTFGNTPCSGLRHFQADSHLISWLHAQNIDYDIVTDRELHDDGYAAISDYKALTTGSHPEYHTTQSLDALRDYRDNGGHLHYLGGNGFYWRIAVHSENDGLLEIRRAEDGIRAWAAEAGEYYNAFDGTYGGLWRRNGRAPQELVGIGFTAQGEFFGDPYRRVNTDPDYDWVFDGIDGEIFGEFGYSGNGAAGFELDHMDHRLGTPENTILLARSVTRDQGFMLVPEEQLTHLTNLSGGTEDEAKHADMIYTTYPTGGTVFATGSITFCGSLPWNGFDNDVSQLLINVIRKSLR